MNSETFIPNKRLKVFFSVVVCVCLCVVCLSSASQTKPELETFQLSIISQWEAEIAFQLVGLVGETVAKSLLLDRPHYDLISSGAALL